MKRLLARTWLKLNGWSVHGTIDHPKFVAIAAPHTSNWDLVFMLATATELGIKVRWLGKHTLFQGPFGWLMRAVGGIPVERSTSHNLVEQAAQHLRDSESMILAVPPSGTRKAVDHWKSGFYWIATTAEVPIALGYLDYGKREAGIGGFVVPSGDVSKDMDKIREFYRDIRGRYPENQNTIRLREEKKDAAA